MKTKEIEYKNFGKCLEISNEEIRLIVTLDFGPRIISYSFLDGENILFEDSNLSFRALNAKMEAVYGKDKPWIIYGGHRLWKAPETTPETYYPDNDAVSYSLTERGAVFTPPVQKWTNYGYEICVHVSEKGTDVTIEHKVTNCGEEAFDFSLWAISAMSPGGMEIVPQPTRKRGAFPKMRMAFWDYDDMTDKRLKWLSRYIILRQDPKAEGNMKFGINNEHGYAMYFNHGDMFLKRFDVLMDGNYPDGGMCYETYTNPRFLEMESLGELKSVKPGETITHTEKWSLHKENVPCITDEDIDKLKDKYIK